MACADLMPRLFTDDILRDAPLRKRKPRPVVCNTKMKKMRTSSDTSDTEETDTSDTEETEAPRSTRTLLQMVFVDKSSINEIAEWIPPLGAPYWVYLMCAPVSGARTALATRRQSTNRRPMTGKLQTHIGKARNPVRKTYQHNKGVLDSKSTRAGAPNWELVCFVGPFPTKQHSLWFRDMWRKSRRNLRRRLDYILNGEYQTADVSSFPTIATSGTWRSILSELTVVKNMSYTASIEAEYSVTGGNSAA